MSIRTRPSTEEYREGWERIFGREVIPPELLSFEGVAFKEPLEVRYTRERGGWSAEVPALSIKAAGDSREDALAGIIEAIAKEVSVLGKSPETLKVYSRVLTEESIERVSQKADLSHAE